MDFTSLNIHKALFVGSKLNHLVLNLLVFEEDFRKDFENKVMNLRIATAAQFRRNIFVLIEFPCASWVSDSLKI